MTVHAVPVACLANPGGPRWPRRADRIGKGATPNGSRLVASTRSPGALDSKALVR